MARKQYFLVIDTETTQTDKVADFGAVVIDRQGKVQTQVGCLVRDFYLDRDNHPLFHVKGVADPLWGLANLPKRYAAYDEMLVTGSRMLASVPAINSWLAKVNAKYRPTATAYNKAFDWDKMRKSGIDCDMFSQSFCLWHAAVARYFETREFRQFVLETHGFNPPTPHGNMSIKTNAEIMARFILGDANFPDEPHTALEDALDYEVPILTSVLKGRTLSQVMDPPPFNWRSVQVRDWYQPK